MADISIPSLDRTDTVDWENVQGDVILRLPKTKEEFVFFVIENPKHFKAKVSQLNITTTEDVHRARERIREAKKQDPACLIPLSGLNIAFSQKGLHALGIKDDLGDVPFSHGQLLDAEALGDDGVQTDKGFEPNWERAFTERIDGVLLATGETLQAVHDTVKAALETLGESVEVVYRLKGSVRPGDQRGHEHFGWNDGISNPAVKNVGGGPLPGQRVVPPGVILLGKEQDPVKNRPSWAVEGSFMVFRQLSQLVPEFHDFLKQNPLAETGPERERGSELLGARLFGRWKSGAPLICTPLEDDPELGKDKCRNNKFEYPTETGEEGQTRCPYAAHIRKMNPRNELELAKVERGSMVRTGIAYGPEVSPNEKEDNTTEYERGLAFVCYQSSLQVGPVSGRQSDWGFRFVQRSWANTVEFPRGKGFEPGWDPIIGQDNGRPRNTLGTSKGPELVLPQDFVVSRGGEYFFTPSIHALKTILSGIDG